MAYEDGSIRTLLGGLLKNRQLVASMRRVMVMSLWEQVVGALVAQKSWPERVTDGVLFVGVTSHVWAQELHLLKPKILARYRQLMGRTALKDVEFRVMRRRPGHDTGLPGVTLHPEPGQALPPATVPDEVLGGISNPEVRELLAPRFARLRAERAWKEQHGWSRCPACQRIYHGPRCPQCETPQH